MEQVLERKSTHNENIKKAYSMLYNEFIHGYISVEEYERYTSLIDRVNQEYEDENV